MRFFILCIPALLALACGARPTQLLGEAQQALADAARLHDDAALRQPRRALVLSERCDVARRVGLDPEEWEAHVFI